MKHTFIFVINWFLYAWAYHIWKHSYKSCILYNMLKKQMFTLIVVVICANTCIGGTVSNSWFVLIREAKSILRSCPYKVILIFQFYFRLLRFLMSTHFQLILFLHIFNTICILSNYLEKYLFWLTNFHNISQ